MSRKAQNTKRNTVWVLGVAVALAALPLGMRGEARAGEPPATYSLVDLGTLGGGYSGATAINASGQVVGWSYTNGPETMREFAFLLTPEDTDGDGAPDLWFRDGNHDGVNDLIIDLGALGTEVWEIEPQAVNDLGQVVGYSQTDEWDGEFYVVHAFLWAPGQGMIDLGAQGVWSWANDINNLGQVVGKFEPPGEGSHGFLITPEAGASGAPVWWRDSDGDGINDLMIDLGPGSAAGINDAGQVAGSAGGRGYLVTPVDTDGDGEPDCWFRDQDGDGVNDLMVELPPLPGDIDCGATAINSWGQVVGVSRYQAGRNTYAHRPVLWDVNAQGQVTLTDIGSVPGEETTMASDLNDAAQVVGTGYSWPTGKAKKGSTTGYLWQDGTLTQLRGLVTDAGGFDTTYLWAIGINNAGQIIGRGLVNAQGRPYIALPSAQQPPPPPPERFVTVHSVTYATEGGKDGKRDLLITVALVDDLKGDPVAGATVSIDVTRNSQHYANGTGTTGADGKVKFRLGKAPSGTYTTTVTDVSGDGIAWDGITPPNEVTK